LWAFLAAFFAAVERSPKGVFGLQVKDSGLLPESLTATGKARREFAGFAGFSITVL